MFNLVIDSVSGASPRRFGKQVRVDDPGVYDAPHA